MTRHPAHEQAATGREPLSPFERRLAALHDTLRDDEPAPALNARVLANARQAIHTERSRRAPWTWGVGTAAGAVIALAAIWQLGDPLLRDAGRSINSEMYAPPPAVESVQEETPAAFRGETPTADMENASAPALQQSAPTPALPAVPMPEPASAPAPRAVRREPQAESRQRESTQVAPAKETSRGLGRMEERTRGALAPERGQTSAPASPPAPAVRVDPAVPPAPVIMEDQAPAEPAPLRFHSDRSEVSDAASADDRASAQVEPMDMQAATPAPAPPPAETSAASRAAPTSGAPAIRTGAGAGGAIAQPPSAGSGAGAVFTSPDAWLMHLFDLLDEGRLDEARAGAEAFRARHPEYPMPRELVRLLDAE